MANVSTDISEKIPERREIPSEFKWNLSDIFEDEESFLVSVKKLEEYPTRLESYRGMLAQSGSKLLEFFRLREEALGEYEKVMSYARLHRDEDTRESKPQSYFIQVQNLGARLMQALSWFSPELIEIPWDTIETWIQESDELAVYRHYLEDEYRVKEHILSSESEYVLALSANFGSCPSQIFHSFNDADASELFPSIEDDGGNRLQLSPSRYSAILETGSRRMRREAFEGLFGTYCKLRNTLASSLKSQVDRDIFYARARRYGSALEAALAGDNIPVEVYMNLLQTVRDNLHIVHRYMKLRKKALKLDELHIYDLHHPMFPQLSDRYTYQEAVKLIMDALKPLGEEYLRNAEKAFQSGWIDVYENAGKYNGAYSLGSYFVHPYILLNYNNTLNDVFTIAHELGHSLHSYFTSQSQPYIYGDYSIFVAEVASTLNEALLMRYLLDSTSEEQRRLNLLSKYISNINDTVIAQTLFAEFEFTIHQMGERNQPLTQEVLSQTYLDLLRSYWGDELTYDDLYKYTWSRIPHFYANFYVYKYATSFAASSALSKRILAGETEAVERYLDFLSSGSSDYPIELLKRAGVDMTTAEPIDTTMRIYEGLVDELEGLLL